MEGTNLSEDEGSQQGPTDQADPCMSKPSAKTVDALSADMVHGWPQAHGIARRIDFICSDTWTNRQGIPTAFNFNFTNHTNCDGTAGDHLPQTSNATVRNHEAQQYTLWEHRATAIAARRLLYGCPQSTYPPLQFVSRLAAEVNRTIEQDEKNGSGRTFVAATRLAACLLPDNALHWPMFDVIQSKLEISGEQDSEPSWGAQSRSRTSGASVSKSPLSWEPLGHSTSAARFHTLYTCSTRTWGRNSFRCQITASSRPSSGSPTSPEERLQVRAHQPGQTEQGGLAGIMGGQGHGSIRTRPGSNTGPDKSSGEGTRAASQWCRMGALAHYPLGLLRGEPADRPIIIHCHDIRRKLAEQWAKRA
ncbi:uncharacterized protein CLUP02_14781 [Colletotrichum lupini]|uniref:Uncharacterized protein n=1 Tax=Colletotrichum lupini TaxID=145971 RepID=A0A9Q8T6S3_9PEZI|nr:uncharacterized protein CLUP02_14781 [Colletotrichum lupini]UQC89252.1 hypothetical protein CLUP02_14781 [Colletotrichum lupini]